MMNITVAISVVYSPAPRQTRQWQLMVPEGTTVKQALTASGVIKEFPELSQDALKLGIWGKRCGAHLALKDNDRIEIYRPLRVDPKVARRERFTRQGTKGTGLFATKRIGAKAGYGG